MRDLGCAPGNTEVVKGGSCVGNRERDLGRGGVDWRGHCGVGGAAFERRRRVMVMLTSKLTRLRCVLAGVTTTMLGGAIFSGG